MTSKLSLGLVSKFFKLQLQA